MHDATTKRSAGGLRRGAFTLIELLAVMLILAVLLALIVSITPYVRNAAAVKKTKVSLKIVGSALDVYFDAKGKYPDDRNPEEPVPPRIDSSLSTPIIVQLMNILANHPKTRHIVGALPKDAWGGKDHVLLDGWGMAVSYSWEAGIGKKPVLISAGPDGAMVGNDVGYQDNIRSDSI